MMALAVVGFASSASADFSIGKCAGPNIAGRGGSFATAAQTVFNFNFKNNFCVGTPGQGVLNVSYDPAGSGAGVKAMEIRTDTPRFGGSDDPPAPAEVNLMNSGGIEEAGKVVADTNESNNGKVHVFPVAVGSVVALVNLPEECDPTVLPDKFRTISAAEVTGEAKKAGLLRVRFTKKLFEEVWSGSAIDAKWSTALPLGSQGGKCDVPITRVVRFDQSGTSFAFKDYLNTIDPAEGWKTTYSTGANLTREWPNAQFGTGGQCGATAAPGKEDDGVDHLTTACANGNGELIKKLAATEGSIGYSDLATARNASPSLAIDASKVTASTAPYWTQVQNGAIAVGSAQETAGSGFTEPTADEVAGYKTTGGSKGSNCLTATFTGVPSGTFGDWSKASGVNAPVGWGICTLTYALVFDDNSTVWGKSAEEEAKARTVKDYEESVLSDSAQGQLFGADYAPLPSNLLALSRADVAEIGWDKTNDGKEKEEEVKKPDPVPGPGPVVNTPPSNEFSFKKSVKKGNGKVSTKLPGAGTLDVLATAKVNGKKVTVAHSVVTATAAGTFDVNIKPKGAAKAALQEKGKLAVSLKLTFTPSGTGGVAKTSTSSLTLKSTPKK
jgi:ABC-type phosphate transport system substrate-binding protein